MSSLDVDYLIIGSGARGMAFADEILHGDPEATVALVDRRGAPGGHWVDAYPYVTLHQPALFYGVGSTDLGAGGRDLASKPEILAYYVEVLEKLQATGRCHVFLRHDFEGEGRCRSLDDPDTVVTIKPRRRLVDSVYIAVSIPATRPPPFPVAPEITVAPPNVLGQVEQRWREYVVIGAGKTGMDALLQLLRAGVDPDRLCWVVSRDAWLIIREGIWPPDLARSFGAQVRAICAAETWQDVYARFEAIGVLGRIWPDRAPTCFRCATVSRAELTALRRLTRVVRMGKVQRIEADRILLDQGQLPTGPDVLHVDCTADGLPARPPRPVFESGRITIQSINMCAPTASAAAIAVAEHSLPDDTQRNACLHPVPPPEHPEDLLHILPIITDNIRAGARWRALRRFVWRNRLSILRHISLWDNLRVLFAVLLWGARSEANTRRIVAGLPPRRLPPRPTAQPEDHPGPGS